MLPEIQAAIAADHRARLLHYLPHRGLFGFPAVHFTARHRLELELAGNAFIHGRAPTRGDVFGFLWRIHPLFRRPDGSLPNAASPELRSPHSGLRLLFRSLRARRALRRAVAASLPLVAECCIYDYLADAFRDRLPTEEKADRERVGLVPPPVPYWLDAFIEYHARTYGMSADEVLDTPIALLFQRRRALAIASGEPVIDHAHEVAAEIMLRRRAQAASSRN